MKYVVKRTIITTNCRIRQTYHNFDSKEKMLSYVKRYATTKGKSIKAVLVDIMDKDNFNIGCFSFRDNKLVEKKADSGCPLKEYLAKEDTCAN